LFIATENVTGPLSGPAWLCQPLRTSTTRTAIILKTLILFGAMLLSMPLSAAQLNLELGANSRTWQTE